VNAADADADDDDTNVGMMKVGGRRYNSSGGVQVV
jgi:hypothetical protein